MDAAAASEAVCAQTAQAFLRDVTVLPQSPEPAQASGQNRGERATARSESAQPVSEGSQPGAPTPLEDPALRVLIAAARRVPPPLTHIYQNAGLSRKQGRQAVQGLCQRGLVREHRFSTGRRGGRLSLLELTEAGWQAASQRGVRQPRPLTRGGWAHDVIAGALVAIGRRTGWRVDCEQPLGGGRVDVVWQGSDGRRIAYQIGLSDPQREAETLARMAGRADTTTVRLVAVVPDKGFGQRLQQALGRQDGSGELGAQVEMRLAGSVLGCLFDSGAEKGGQGGNT